MRRAFTSFRAVDHPGGIIQDYTDLDIGSIPFMPVDRSSRHADQPEVVLLALDLLVSERLPRQAQWARGGCPFSSGGGSDRRTATASLLHLDHHQCQRQIVHYSQRQIVHAKTPNNPAEPGRSLRPAQASLRWKRSIRRGKMRGRADAGSAGGSVRRPGVRGPLQVWLSMVLLLMLQLIITTLFSSRPDALTSRSRPRAAPLTPRPRGTLHAGAGRRRLIF
jgi:hypothetical protein